MLLWEGTLGSIPVPTLSPQQAAAVAAVASGAGSLVIEAVAGAGKTSTILASLASIPSNKSVAICAFNKTIAAEIQYKIGDKFPNVKVGTVHSFGFGAVRRAVNRVTVDGSSSNGKLHKIARDEFNGDYENLRTFVVSAASMAKQYGIGACAEDSVENWHNMLTHQKLWDSLPDNYSDEQAIDAAQYLLNASNRMRNIVDYSDMVYFPILFGMKMWQHDIVFVDEAQDINASRLALIKMMLKPSGRVIAVGDPRQAVYGFTGADHRSLDTIREAFNAVTLPLSVTFRCPKAIVSLANRWVDHIEAHESAPDGVVDSCEMHEIATLATKDDAILCRNTKPLVELAYKLIRQGVACRVEGRSIGQGLINLAMRWKSVKNVGELAVKVEEWAERETAKHKAKGNDSRVEVISDQVQTLEVFIAQCDDSAPISTLVAKIDALFGDTKQGEIQRVLTLSTIHRAKGKEWDRVFAIGMETYSPSRFATEPWELQQEDNLCYVQVTRAKQHLTLVNVPPKVA